MKYFKNCTTIDDVKKLYRQLAKDNHPDKGGTLETMQAINTEYSFACAKILKGEKLTDDEINEQIRLSEEYKQAIEAISPLPGIEIELIGTWLWVTGATRQHCSKARGGTGILPDAGFKWANKKENPSAWFFRTDEYKTRGGKKSMEEIRTKFGSTKVNPMGGKYIR